MVLYKVLKSEIKIAEESFLISSSSLYVLLSKLSSVVLFPCMFYRKGSFNPGEHTTSFAGSREIALKDSVLEDATRTVFSLFVGTVDDWIC